MSAMVVPTRISSPATNLGSLRAQRQAEQIGRAEQGKDIMNLDHLFYDLKWDFDDLEGET